MSTTELTESTFEKTIAQGVRGLDMDAVKAEVAQEEVARSTEV